MEDNDLFLMGVPASQMVDTDLLDNPDLENPEYNEDGEEGYSGVEEDFFGDNPQKPEESDYDYITAMLARKGIDRNAVQFEDEDGNIQTVPFDELTDAEKESILSTEEDLPITDAEIDTLQYLRDNHITLEEYAQWQRKQAVDEYIASQKQESYTVDEMSDEDLIRFDLQDRFPELEDSEIDELVEQEMLNEKTFVKKAAALRRQYQELEANYLKEQDEVAEQEREAQYQELSDMLAETARNTNNLYGFVLDERDKQEILDYLLDRDVNGQPAFNKLFKNPDALFRMAWFALKGGDAFKATNDYWERQLAESRRGEHGAMRRESKPSKSRDLYGMEQYFT